MRNQIIIRKTGQVKKKKGKHNKQLKPLERGNVGKTLQRVTGNKWLYNVSERGLNENQVSSLTWK